MNCTQPSPRPVPLQPSNALNTRDRTRLVRSARKLSTVLGTTPRVACFDEPVPITLLPIGPSRSSSPSSSRCSTPDSEKVSLRHGQASQKHPHTLPRPNTGSAASLALLPARSDSLKKKPSTPLLHKPKTRSRELPRPLVLRLNAVPRAPAHPCAPVSPAPSTTSTLLTPTMGAVSASTTPAVTPTSPAFPSVAETRRKRMAKLTRTLGEIVPPQLVFTPSKKLSFAPAEVEVDAMSSAAPVRTRNRRSMSVDFGTPTMAPYSRASRVWMTGNSAWQGEWNRKDIKEVQKQLRSLKAR